MTCPGCGKSDIRRSRSSSWNDGLQHVLGRQAYRCRGCRRRFYSSAFAQPSLHSPGASQRKHSGVKVVDFRRRKRIVRRIITVAVFVVMFSLFGLFLHHVSQDHPPQSIDQDVDSPNE
jgi:hypothetical protein